MEKSNLWLLIRSLSGIEQKEARRFLASPYFNLRTDVQLLFDQLLHTDEPDKALLWPHIYPDEPFDESRFRLLMSYLNRLLERFLLVQETAEPQLGQKLRLAALYRARGLRGHYERHARAFYRNLYAQPLRDAWFHGLLRDYHFEEYETTITQNPTDTHALQALAYSTDVHYLSYRLRLICLELSQKNVYQAGANDALLQEVVGLAKRPEWSDLPAVSTYISAVYMLAYPEEGVYFKAFQEKIASVQGVFSADEMRAFYMFSINHCIRSANRGNREMEPEVLRLYRAALEAGYLFENGVLSRFTFHNIVAAGLRSGELPWVADFIKQYQIYLEKRYRDSSVNFNLARLRFAEARYGDVLSLLQNANYRDILLNLAAKTLLLKTYYILDEYDLLSSHLDALRNYLQRKKVIGYHRLNMLNIIRYTERLVQAPAYGKAALEFLQEEIRTEQVLSEREWLLEVMNEA